MSKTPRSSRICWCTLANGGLTKTVEDQASPGSEAKQVILMFRALSEPQKQDLLNFLRSL